MYGWPAALQGCEHIPYVDVKLKCKSEAACCDLAGCLCLGSVKASDADVEIAELLNLVQAAVGCR